MSIEDWGFSKRQGPDWPVNPDGKGAKPAFLTNAFSTNMELEIIVGLLETSGIPVITKYPGDGSFGKVILGMSGTGSDIYVPEVSLDEAKRLLESYEEKDDAQQLQD